MLPWLFCGCAMAQPPTGPQFGLIGDAPYNDAEVVLLDRVIDEMNAHPVRFQWKNFDFQMT